MLALEIRFVGGRYHATPWDSHVNEGVVEWPPSPWRILRALIATRDLKATEEVGEVEMRTLVDALSAELPRYSLPIGLAASHTRHYMPAPPRNPTKVFDTFLHIPPDSTVVACWESPVLEPAAFRALDLLARRLGYLGRAEAWTDARLVDGHERIAINCTPAAGARDDRHRVRVLAPLAPAELQHWRAGAVEERSERRLNQKILSARDRGKPTDGIQLSPRERSAIETSLPASIYEALKVDTATMRKAGWNRPPASRWVDYVRPRLDEPTPIGRRPAPSKALPIVARYALAGSVLPRLTDAVLEAEKVRVALLSHSGAAPVFSGRDPTTGALLQGHRHCAIVPEANGRHGQITHITVIARMGFDEYARTALSRLRRIWQRSRHDLQVVLLGMGQPEDFAGTNLQAGQCPLLARSDTWVSRTPFVSTRHPKRRRSGRPVLDEHGFAIGSPQHDLIRLLEEQGFPRPFAAEPIDHTTLGGKPTRWLAFRTQRGSGKGARAATHGFGFRIRFPEAVTGPVLAGYGAHFGLGCFVPAEMEALPYSTRASR